MPASTRRKTARPTRAAYLVPSLLVATSLLYGQDSPAPTAGNYEALPELKASEILRADVLKGPHHQVREEVTTSAGANHFTIDSDFGVFEADGNQMLVTRIGEIDAIARLKEISRTDQYASALANAAKGSFNAAKNAVQDPVTTVQNVPKGIMKFMNRAGQSVKNIGKKSGDSSGASTSDKMIASTKRKVAVQLGVDPYTTNQVLQKQLGEISWAVYAGGATFSLGTMPIGGAVGVALTATGVTKSLDQVLAEKTPGELKALNRQSLVAMGASGAEADRLLGNAAFTPTQQTAFVLNLKALDGVANRASFVRLAARNSSSEADAIFCVQTAALMATIHSNRMALVRLEAVGDFPISVARDGSVVVALQWDYAAWTPAADAFAQAVQEKVKAPVYFVGISGMVSPLLRQELEKRHFKVADRMAAGPLK